VLATSREGLAVSGEHVLPLSPLQVPTGDTLGTVAGCEAVRLFVERAEDVRPGFVVEADNAAVLARLCRRLDGTPLAIELAAARVRSLALSDILSHLDRRFRLLTGGRRSALRRQQTLRGTIDWSYDLLEDPERVLLRRLAVFVGGFDLAAAESVGAGDPVDAFDVAGLIDRLVDKSLVVADPSGSCSRFRLLEMIRDYLWDRLADSGETEELSRRHAEFFVAFAAAADSGLRGPDELDWTERVERELDNLRAAVSWAVEAGQADTALGIIASLTTVFATRIGFVSPVGIVAERAAAIPQALGHPLRCVALASAAWAAFERGDPDRAGVLADTAMDVAADRSPQLVGPDAKSTSRNAKKLFPRPIDTTHRGLLARRGILPVSRSSRPTRSRPQRVHRNSPIRIRRGPLQRRQSSRPGDDLRADHNFPASGRGTPMTRRATTSGQEKTCRAPLGIRQGPAERTAASACPVQSRNSTTRADHDQFPSRSRAACLQCRTVQCAVN
jgi:hypothetical protein